MAAVMIHALKLLGQIFSVVGLPSRHICRLAPRHAAHTTYLPKRTLHTLLYPA